MDLRHSYQSTPNSTQRLTKRVGIMLPLSRLLFPLEISYPIRRAFPTIMQAQHVACAFPDAASRLARIILTCNAPHTIDGDLTSHNISPDLGVEISGHGNPLDQGIHGYCRISKRLSACQRTPGHCVRSYKLTGPEPP